jgi:hypothetical protein
MDIVGTYLLYLLISTGLTVVVGIGLARSGRAFLLDVFGGNDTLARAVSRLLVTYRLIDATVPVIAQLVAASRLPTLRRTLRDLLTVVDQLSW